MDKLYHKKGQASVAVGSLITLIVGVGVGVLVLIFVGALGGQTYNLVEDDILLIGGVLNTSGDGWNQTSSNFTIRDSITGSIGSSFDALNQTGNYLPIIVLAVVISLVLALVLSFTAFGGNSIGGRGGSAL